ISYSARGISGFSPSVPLLASRSATYQELCFAHLTVSSRGISSSFFICDLSSSEQSIPSTRSCTGKKAQRLRRELPPLKQGRCCSLRSPPRSRNGPSRPRWRSARSTRPLLRSPLQGSQLLGQVPAVGDAPGLELRAVQRSGRDHDDLRPEAELLLQLHCHRLAQVGVGPVGNGFDLHVQFVEGPDPGDIDA